MPVDRLVETTDPLLPVDKRLVVLLESTLIDSG